MFVVNGNGVVVVFQVEVLVLLFGDLECLFVVQGDFFCVGWCGGYQCVGELVDFVFDQQVLGQVQQVIGCDGLQLGLVKVIGGFVVCFVEEVVEIGGVVFE